MKPSFVVILVLVALASGHAFAAPIAQEAYLKASNNRSGIQFGRTVGISGDTAVVGAWKEDSNATGVNGNQSGTGNSSGAAYVFVRNAGLWSQQAYLKASNTGLNDNFGISVGVSGDTIVVGADEEDSSATGVNGNQGRGSADTGAAYVFVRNGSEWTQEAYLKPSNTGAFDHFGHSVAISGDTIVVGSFQEDSAAIGVNGDQSDNTASDAGAAYVFVRNNGVWSQQAYLKPSNSGASDYFGESVAISGETIVVGARLEDGGATGVNGPQNNQGQNSGAAYVFVRNGADWSQQAYLKASNTGFNDYFGYSVSVSEDTVVIGAYQEDGGSSGVNGNQTFDLGQDSGAAYVFVRNELTWSQQAYLKASNNNLFATNDYFGWSVSVSGDTLIVGAYDEDSNAIGVNGDQGNNSANHAGAAYLFLRDGTSWSQHAYLKSSNNDAGDLFAFSVAASDQTVLVGAYGERSNSVGVNGNQLDNSAAFAGAAYVFTISECPNVLGDMNCDCAMSVADVYAFSQALLNGTFYPGCSLLSGDLNGDGQVNGADIQGFVDLLVP